MKISPLLLGIFFLFAGLRIEAQEKSKSAGLPPPKTAAEACERLDTILSYDDKDQIRIMRGGGLIDASVFNRYSSEIHAFFENNPELYKDLEATSKSIEGDAFDALHVRYWEYLNQDLPQLPLNGLSPDDYFNKILFYLQRAYLSGDVRITNRLPIWLFDPSRRWQYAPKIDPTRMEAASRLLSVKQPVACVALLYFGQSELSSKVVQTIEGYLGKNEPRIIYPVRVTDDAYYAAMLTSQDIAGIFDIKEQYQNNKSYRYPRDYVWKTFSIGDVALFVLNQIERHQWASAEEYFTWKEAQKNNPYFKGYSSKLSEDEIKAFIASPLTLLRFLILAGWVDVDDDDGGVPYRISSAAKIFFSEDPQIIFEEEGSSCMSMKEPATNAWVNIYPVSTRGALDIMKETPPDRFACAAQKLLKQLADSIDPNELLDAISPAALGDYNLNYKTPELREYSYFLRFVLAVEKQRLMDTGRKKEMWDVCYFYYRHGENPGYYNDYLARLLFEIDPQKMRSVVDSKLNLSKRAEGSDFEETELLKAMIAIRFEEYQKFIEQRFWLMYRSNLDAHPSERTAILSSLKFTNDETRKLYKKIVADRRFKPLKDDP